MIDDSGYPSAFEGKQILLIGTSNTTFGNIVGINHLSHILDWLGAAILEKVCIPFIQEKFANDDIKVDERLNEALIGFANC
jgi:NAD(P)H-dependent FMN reductase